MARRPLVIVAALLALAACGREGSLSEEIASAGTTPAPEATTAAPGASPGATTSPGAAAATAKPTIAPDGGGRAQAPTPPASGALSLPKDGRYIYSFKGESTDPFNPGQPPQRFDGEQFYEFSHQGNVYTQEDTNSERPGRFTTRTRWESSRILLLSVKNETSGGDFSCTFDPPLVIAKFPIKPETFPTQPFKGQGNACMGKLDVTVVSKENATDATGKTWSAWRVRVRIEAGSSQVTTTTDETRWIPPELGVEVKRDSKVHGEIRTPTGSSTFDGTAISLLKSRP